MTPPNNIRTAYATGTTNVIAGNLANLLIVGAAGAGYRYRLYGAYAQFTNAATTTSILWGWFGDGTTATSVFNGVMTYTQGLQGIFLPQGLPMPIGGAIQMRCRCSNSAEPVQMLVNYTLERVF